MEESWYREARDRGQVRLGTFVDTWVKRDELLRVPSQRLLDRMINIMDSGRQSD